MILSQPSNLVKNEVVKKTVYDELVKRTNLIQATDTSSLVKQTDYYTKNFKIKEKRLDHDYDKFILLHKNLIS